ncbi:Mycolic acid cyclopropane synthase [Macleaya cordata]|uniref:Mycolic acid cyclopropane synthase n=1 Tax=Macleaya cordata TaxID=56857 RepID=A0A200Q216_MACCD|nr:Mycolic acid cyclopropane synthase [Macleaya cordata]
MATEALNPKKEAVVDLWKRMELELVPDEEIRKLMKIVLEKRINWDSKPSHHQQLAQTLDFTKSLRSMKMATEIETLDAKVYETPSSFQQIMCGESIKESSGLFTDETISVEEAHIKMLDLYCERAHVKDGQSILDLGCGHGSLVLHVAQKHRNCNVTGVTNSLSQKEFIVEQCKKLHLSNVEIILADVTTLEMEATFDRVFVIGLIEHMKNFELFLRKISEWMKQDDSLLFLENYFHINLAYHCEQIDEEDWYNGYIFPSGSMVMPSASCLLYFQDDVSVVHHWILSGSHFARTFEEWLKRIDSKIDEIKGIFESFYGISKEEAAKLTNYWRVFCITAAEMFGYNHGEEWMISHLLFNKN